MMLRGQRVLARVDDAGRPLAEADGRVEVRYKPSDGRAYRAAARNLDAVAGAELLPDDHCAEAGAAPAKSDAGAKKVAKAAKKAASAAAISDDAAGAIVVYADGACTGNPGPAGLGVAIFDDATRRELSEFLGPGTNNVAELTAILRAAEALAGETRPIEIRTDSQYSIGVLTKGWKAKANVELVASVKAALARLAKVRVTYVPGHAGVAGNELADALARHAVDTRKTSGWTARAK